MSSGDLSTRNGLLESCISSSYGSRRKAGRLARMAKSERRPALPRSGRAAGVQEKLSKGAEGNSRRPGLSRPTPRRAPGLYRGLADADQPHQQIPRSASNAVLCHPGGNPAMAPPSVFVHRQNNSQAISTFYPCRKLCGTMASRCRSGFSRMYIMEDLRRSNTNPAETSAYEKLGNKDSNLD